MIIWGDSGGSEFKNIITQNKQLINKNSLNSVELNKQERSNKWTLILK